MDLPLEANLWGETTFEEKGREAVASPMLLSAYDLWTTNLRSRTLPSRADFDPIEMPKLLLHIILVDVERPKRLLRVRLSGTNVVNMFGGDYTVCTWAKSISATCGRRFCVTIILPSTPNGRCSRITNSGA